MLSGSNVVDWLLQHVEGFPERRDARKYASLMLKSGYIRHTVNKLTFSEQCYYVFGELTSSFANLKIRDEGPPSSGWRPSYHASTSEPPPQPPIYAPMPYATTGYESNAYSYPQEHSINSGSGEFY